ncbi:helix-hairpin-helix domain-containing protein [Streptomyces abyssomicinicus]|uniref:helix-hairpin-helix domain-containing protein n=1 Tax=Streptomyces abyssomicinicus TaxID=574929 RepID=UPI00124FA288|nr:helix-hairpin-helix domain-containing protein [Streptomyces abyssomicinicus]
MTTDPETTEQPEPGPREEAAAGDGTAVEGAGSPEGADSPADTAPAGGGAAEAAEGAAGSGAGAGAEVAGGTGSEADGAAGAAGGAAEGKAADGADGGTEGADGGDGEAEGADVAAEGAGEASAEAPEVSEAEAELRAQKLERERIERRKAAKQGPVEAGGKLSGTAAELLAAVRAVESGEKPAGSVFSEPPAPRRVAVPEPERPRHPVTPPPAAVAPAGPAPAAVEAVRAVLAAGGAPEALAPAAAAVLGEGADALLREDPWQLLRVEGVRPEHADAFARALPGPEVRPDDERRGRALTVHLLERAALSGHTALEAPALATALAGQGVPDPEAAVQSAVAEGDVLVFQDALDDAPSPSPAAVADEADGTGEQDGEGEPARPVRVLIGLERYALAEESLADGLARLVNTAPAAEEADWEAAASRLGGSAAELVRAVAGHALVLHTGGEAARAEPAALLAAAATLGLRVCAVTHTADGRGRLRAALAGGPVGERAVVTAAGLLSGAQGPGRDADGALDLDLLVVLDAPQLGVEHAAMLVESLPDGARLVLGGDPGTLWSAGAGRVFADLLAAKVCPQVASRTPDPGPVGELVSAVGVGELISVDSPGHEVAVVPVRDPREAVHRTVQLIADSVPRAIGVPSEQTQVITPGHGGAVGTRVLNPALKERFNPGPGRFAGFDPGDRVAYSPEPGRTALGRVVTGDAQGLHLDLGGAPVVVAPDDVERTLRHGWAVTAHQAVGHRWPAVVAVLPGDAGAALTRAWVYTAFGRAERHLSVVQGVGPALAEAVASALPRPRTTRLPALLRAADQN